MAVCVCILQKYFWSLVLLQNRASPALRRDVSASRWASLWPLIECRGCLTLATSKTAPKKARQLHPGALSQDLTVVCFCRHFSGKPTLQSKTGWRLHPQRPSRPQPWAQTLAGGALTPELWNRKIVCNINVIHGCSFLAFHLGDV